MMVTDISASVAYLLIDAFDAGSYNGGVPPTLPFSQADTNINCSYIKMEVVVRLPG